MNKINPQATEKNKKTGTGNPAFIPFRNLDRAAEIAYYYGFMPIEAPKIHKEDAAISKKMFDGSDTHHDYSGSDALELSISPEEKLSLFRFAQEHNLINPATPLMTYYQGYPKRPDSTKRYSPAIKRYSLDIIGTQKSVAEAELIKTALEILREEGFTDLFVDVNSVGDKESLQKYSRDLGNYLRKHITSLHTHSRQLMKKDSLSLLECGCEHCDKATAEGPKSVAFLSEQSRLHLKEVLEFVESMKVPFKINPNLVGSRRLCCHTIFLIKTLDTNHPSGERTLALGYRYAGLQKYFEWKREVFSAGITIAFSRTRGSKEKKSHAPKKPKVYFIQIGFDAKRKSLDVIEALRHEKIPVHQSLSKDKLSSQISTAENMGVPFVIIMGQREALEDSVIVRNMQTRFQETVPIPKLSEYLKKLKIS